MSLPRRLMRSAALRAALAAAGQQIAVWPRLSAAMPRRILEFQVAMLEDDDFLDPMLCGDRRGQRLRDTAWSSALDAQIADYNAAADDYFRARAADLADLRDRVLRTLVAARARRPKFRAARSCVADDLPPSRFLEIDWSRGGGLALSRGSPTSHVAMLARARGIPMIVRLGSHAGQRPHRRCSTARAATLELDPGAEQIGLFERRRDLLPQEPGVRACYSAPRPPPRGRATQIRLLINIQRVRGS